MFKILIVDDEKTTRDSLREVIPWNELHITTVTVAKNGLEALELAKENQPDILLTDVRMPKMDGLELAGQVRGLYPECKIIFLSGYADKDYLKKAIHLKAVNYIEKPINPDEIKAVIQEAVALRQEELQKNNQILKLQSSIAETRPLIRQALVLELIKGAPDITYLTGKYEEFFTGYPPNTFFNVAYLILNWRPGIDPNHKERLKESLLQIFSGETPGFAARCLAGFDEQGNIVLIRAGNSSSHPSDIKNTFQRLLERILEIAGDNFTVFFGIGTSAGDIGKIPESYQNAVAATSYQFYLGGNQIFSYTDIHDTPFKIERSRFDSFKEFLNLDNQGAAEEFVVKLTEEAQLCMDHQINRVKNIYFHLLLVVFEAALERELIDPFGNDEKGYIWQEIDAKLTLKDLAEYVISSIRGIFSRLDEKDAVSRKAYEIMRYIRENYADKELSIQTIGNHVYISPTYLCAFFKKTTGKTLNEFITEVRIEKAKQLLKDSRIKLYEVATSVGFTDVNYFSTLFKRNVGCTPSEFRGKH